MYPWCLAWWVIVWPTENDDGSLTGVCEAPRCSLYGSCAWPSGRMLGCLQIYSMFLGGLGIVLLDHGTWSSGIGLGFPITCLPRSSISCHNRVDLTSSFLGIRYPYWNDQVYSSVGAHTSLLTWVGMHSKHADGNPCWDMKTKFLDCVTYIKLSWGYVQINKYK